MKKALFVATVVGFLASFEQNDIKLLQGIGYEVHIATDLDVFNHRERLDALNALEVIKHDIKFSRNPFHVKNTKALRKLKALIKKEHFDLVHCHTPVGGVLGRMAAHVAHVPKVIYTAHGFHFFKGAPLKNWLMFYPVEKLCSRWTDVLITINDEDYGRAQKFHAKKIERIHGVGIDISKFSNVEVDREQKRAELGLNSSDKLIFTVGELDRDKNHIVVLEAMKTLGPKGYKFMVAGKGALMESHQSYIKENGLEDCVELLGYRSDVPELLQVADLYVFPSLFEGLSVALMEAVTARMPIACTNVRGNVDTVITPESYFGTRDPDGLVKVIEKLDAMSKEEKEQMAEKNYQNLLKYQLSEVSKEMEKIYRSVDVGNKR